ncbi:MAG: TonB-dependent receptor [Dysgonomonas mossii]|uniref:TonB-dependent receptor n=1 Tax=Dysgonomonas mossii TaxID=163665 RepID=UPI001D7C9EE5|nr:carboxypeptidase-like regulatory domain-containing protein [Dysgonomonas mossii]MBS5796503.1 TonB-dependent receptor [Dysgonomonas mossii]MBS7111749.1 TonB-dependent receptor [Dysgonomonas mossii]
MKKSLLLCFLFLCIIESAYCQFYTISGKLLDKKHQTPIEYATIYISDLGLAVISDIEGKFTIKNIPAGFFELDISILGYEKKAFKIQVDKNKNDLLFYLAEDNLLLNEIVVTAEKKVEDLTTAYTIERAALDQIQVLNITEIAALLPGGQTSKKTHLAGVRGAADSFNLRSNGGSELGLSSFGTVVEVDGVRISNNSQFIKEVKGSDTRNIASNNIESVEVITGVPSVEHGDLSNGMIRINSKKGKSPLNIELSTKPNTKSIAIDKGFLLGKKWGILNTSFEHTKSNSDIASPYTTYVRNNLSLIYSKVFNPYRNNPLNFSLGLTGNVGGYNSKGDPDAFVDTYTKERDNALRLNMKLDWLINKPWITKLEFSGTLNYSDLQSEKKENKDSNTSTAAIHTSESGYFIGSLYDINPNAEIILIPGGYWYTTRREDSKPLLFTAKMKANWVRKFGDVTNRFMLGSDFNRTTNLGKGIYYTDMRYAPTWREYKYSDQSAVNNLALFAENEVAFLLPSETSLKASIGLRSDLTYISKSEYGTINSLSPRVSAKYIFWNRPKNTLSLMSLRAGFGDAVKLPSSYILNPTPTYQDRLVFTPGTTAKNTTYYAYNTMPSTTIYNPNLKWQRSRLIELEFNARIGQVDISLLAYNSKTIAPYADATLYTPYSYKFTDQTALDNNLIPEANRSYAIDKTTGIVTVSDLTGNLPSQQLAYKERNTFKTNSYYYNESDFSKRGLEWVINFGKIPSIHTSFQVDGSYNYYRGLKTKLIAYSPSLSQNMADGNPYKYIGLYEGTDDVANGSLSKKITNNLSISTHIPAIRLIVSLRLESCLYDYKQKLSESSTGSRGFVIDNRSDYIPSTSETNIYKGDYFVALYPLYYVSLDDMNTKIPFKEKFLWAKDNDSALFNELARMVVRSNVNYYFKPTDISAYFSANLNVTKELGDHVSISFLANNFFNNVAKVKNKQNNSEYSLFGSGYLPEFYYGLTLRIKL